MSQKTLSEEVLLERYIMYPLPSHVSLHNHLNNSENQTLGGARLSGFYSAKLQENPEQKFGCVPGFSREVPRVSAALGWAEQLLPQPWGAQGPLESLGQCPSPQNNVPNPKTISRILKQYPLSKIKSLTQNNVLYPKQCPSSRTMSFIQDNVFHPR